MEAKSHRTVQKVFKLNQALVHPHLLENKTNASFARGVFYKNIEEFIGLTFDAYFPCIAYAYPNDVALLVIVENDCIKYKNICMAELVFKPFITTQLELSECCMEQFSENGLCKKCGNMAPKCYRVVPIFKD